MIGTKKEIITYLLEQEEDKKFELKEHKEKRGLSANSYFHTLINQLARYYKMGDDEMKIKMVLEYGTIAKNDNGEIITCKLPKGTDTRIFYDYCKWYGEQDGFNFYMFYKQTSKMDSKEFSMLLDGVVGECEEVGIQTMTPEELNKLRSLERK